MTSKLPTNHAGKTDKLIFVQEVATPHNNVLIRELRKSGLYELELHYKLETDAKYTWSEDLAGANGSREIFGRFINLRFLVRLLSARKSRILLIGWANLNTALLHVLFFLTRQKFNHWTDLTPEYKQSTNLVKRILRFCAYRMLSHSRARIFCVNTATMEILKGYGIASERLVLLPIFIDTFERLPEITSQRDQMAEKYKLDPDKKWFVSGSRLVRSKGFDLLIDATSKISEELRRDMQVIIVGSGEEEAALSEQVEYLGLEESVMMLKWLDPDDFLTLVQASDVLIQPSRSESFGSTTLGMSMGLPVIGSKGAGAAQDRIEHEKNGFLYAPDDTNTLASHMEYFILHPRRIGEMGAAAHMTSKKWPASQGVAILHENMI